MTEDKNKTKQENDDALDEALEQSFPASDPPPQTQPTKKIGGTKRSDKLEK
ncbi:MAG TPA: hypothetical protein VGN05_10030 [Parvibaculum sp.]